MSRQISLDKFFPNLNGNSHSMKWKVEDRNDYYRDYDKVKILKVAVMANRSGIGSVRPNYTFALC